ARNLCTLVAVSRVHPTCSVRALLAVSGMRTLCLVSYALTSDSHAGERSVFGAKARCRLTLAATEGKPRWLLSHWEISHCVMTSVAKALGWSLSRGRRVICGNT